MGYRNDLTGLQELLESHDWCEVFGEGNGGNCTQDVESVDGTDCKHVVRIDVAEIVASANGYNDGDEWLGVFRMNDGRWLAASGSCDHTGWDCRAGNTLTVASSFDALVTSGLTPEQCRRLGIEHPAHCDDSDE